MSNNTANKLRNKLTQRLMERVWERSEKGFNCEDVVMDIAFDDKAPAETRVRAASIVLGIIHPKAQSVEMTIEQPEDLNMKEMDQKITDLLAKAMGAMQKEEEL